MLRKRSLELPEDFQKFFDDPVGFRREKVANHCGCKEKNREFLESLYKKQRV